MKINLNDSRMIVMLVDEQKHVVIFPYGKSSIKYENSDGTSGYKYYPSYYPIELKAPYKVEELAQKMKQGIDEWGKHKCYHKFTGNDTWEEKYYGIKDFKNAMKGKRMIDFGWDDIGGIYTSLLLPCKRGYSYLGIIKKELNDNADWLDFAKSVMELINVDLCTLDAFRVYKRDLNI